MYIVGIQPPAKYKKKPKMTPTNYARESWGAQNIQVNVPYIQTYTNQYCNTHTYTHLDTPFD